MKTLRAKQTNDKINMTEDSGQKGSAIVIALFVLAMMGVFVALAMTRSATEAAAVGNETAEGRTFYAAQASLEVMTRNFNKIFEIKLNPTATDLDDVKNTKPTTYTANNFNFTGYTFAQERPEKTSDSITAVLPGGPFAGLYAIRDSWRLRTTVTDPREVQVELTRNVLNNRIPIFQFGIFYDDDLELYRPPRFSFGGRVHSNRHFFIAPGPDGVYFDSRVTAAGQVVTQTWRNGHTGDSPYYSGTYIKNASGAWKQLYSNKGSVINTSSGASDNVFMNNVYNDDKFVPNPDLPPSKLNPTWAADSAQFDGNLLAKVRPLKLPLKVGNDNADLVEMVKRGKNIGDVANINGIISAVNNAAQDDPITRSERFANKTGIRISLADSKAELPGCASGVGTTPVTTQCGVRLDGDMAGAGDDPPVNGVCAKIRAGTVVEADVNNALQQLAARNCSRGYQPRPMSGGYLATRFNGERFYNLNQQLWIKVETVDTDATTGAVITTDITADFLSLGVTDAAPLAAGLKSSNGTNDSRSIIKLQRFAIPGEGLPGLPISNQPATTYLYRHSLNNYAVRYIGDDGKIDKFCIRDCIPVNSDPKSVLERFGHLQKAAFDGKNMAIVPFPIKMFDTREGVFNNDELSLYTTGRVAVAGVMSMVDIDVANLRQFLSGAYNGNFQNGLTSNGIPQKGGWVVYVSDRRGDMDFDGEYDMEDIYGASPGNDDIKQDGEDVNKNGFLDRSYTSGEAVRYNAQEWADLMAVADYSYYRRGVRLINAQVLPGVYDAATPSNTRGFTFASENGVYIRGNYNATEVAAKYDTSNTPYNEYLPFNTANHIPASIVADSVTILSNNWNDAKSFIYPYSLENPGNAADMNARKATETTVRFAMISGDTISNMTGTPNQGGLGPKMNGGVHNFKRFLERWTDPEDSNFRVNLNYSGSLINLFNSRNNNGSFKCCNVVYNPPIRNWVFDSTFLDPNRLPPGTPFFQYVQTTGFQRTNN